MKTSLSAFCSILFFLIAFSTEAQTIGTFNSVAPGVQTQSLVIPSTHTFQRIIRSGDLLNDATTLGNDLDFTGYVPISGSSLNGYLSISSESTPAKVGIMTVTYNPVTHIWGKSNSGNVVFPTAAFGSTPVSRFCSGTVTPNGTIMVSEESVSGGDNNADGYTDIGWIIEIDPATKTVMESDATHTGVDKLWALGRASRENALILSDNRTLYTGADAGANSFVYKFIANTPGNFSSGQLYVLVTTGAGLTTNTATGTWALLANTTQANRNNTVSLSTAAGAYSFNGVEDVEVGPDGRIYFTAKGPGRIYRFTDNGATVSNMGVFVENTTYDVDPGPAVANEPWGIGNDNLAFDNEGNLWVLQDGDRNHIWVVGPTHTAAAPKVRLFGKTPAGSEPTGITFTPDNKFMFISFQHPSVGNTASQTDASGAAVVFNTHTTVVIATIANLGPLATLAAQYSDFNVAPNNGKIQLAWSVSQVSNHGHFEIERSLNGRYFERIYSENQPLADGASQSFTYNDENFPNGTVLFYRIKQVTTNGNFQYSVIKSIKAPAKKTEVTVYPNPAKDILNLDYEAGDAATLNITVTDATGRIVISDRRSINAGKNKISVDIVRLLKGNYNIMLSEESNKSNTEKLLFSKL